VVVAICVMALWAGQAAAGESSAGYLTIQGAFLREDFAQVVPLAQRFILQHPDAPEVPRVWLWLSLSLDRLEQADEALRELNRLKARLRPGEALWVEALFWEGEISRRAFDMARARSAYEQLLAEAPASSWSTQAQLGLGLIALHEQAFDEAIAHFHAVASQEAGTASGLDAQLYQGLAHLQTNEFQEAAMILQPLVSRLREPVNRAQAACYLGESLSGLGRHADAAEQYRQALAAAPASQWGRVAQFGLGWAQFKAGACEESVRAFEAYLAHPEAEHHTEALYAQGHCLLQLTREPEALARFEQIVSRSPDHALALDSGFLLVESYRRQGRLVLAKELLHALIRRHRTPASQGQIQLRLGAIALEQGNGAQARTIFNLAAEHEEAAIRQAALSGLGDVQLFFGHLGSARRFYEEAMRLDPGASVAAYAQYQLGRIHLQAGAFEQAVRIFQQLLHAEDQALADDAHLALVIAYLNQQEHALARGLLAAIRRQRPTEALAARAAYYEALLALGDGDDAAAARLCQELVARAPASDEALEARLLLADLEVQAGAASEAIDALRRLYEEGSLSRSHRAKLAKRLGDFARTDGRYPEAIQSYAEAAQLWPSLDAEAAYWSASCYEAGGDLDLASRWYQQADQPPWQLRGQLAVAKLLERQERLGEARAIYERLAGQPIPEAGLIQERLVALGGGRLQKERRW